MKTDAKQYRDGLIRRLFRNLTRNLSSSADMLSNQDESPLNVAPGVRVSAHDNGLAFFDTLTGRVFVCNRAGARIWLRASKGLSIDAAAEEITILSGVPRERAKHDIRAFVRDLERHELVTRKVR